MSDHDECLRLQQAWQMRAFELMAERDGLQSEVDHLQGEVNRWEIQEALWEGREATGHDRHHNLARCPACRAATQPHGDGSYPEEIPGSTGQPPPGEVR